MSANQRSVRVNDVNINVVETGKGSPSLIFLHYWGGSTRTWTPVIANLSRTHHCVAIDFRGWGESDKTAPNYELEVLAADVVGVIGRLRLKEFIIVGHSMGGKVAQLLASQRPEGLKGLILIAPAPPTALAVPEEQRQGMIASYQAREGVETVIGILSALPLSEAYREQIVEDTLRGSVKAKRAWPEQGMIQDISLQVSRITVAVCVIVGDADKIESENALRTAFSKAIPSVEFVVLPGVGHLSPLEATDAVASAIRATRIMSTEAQDGEARATRAAL